MMPPPPADYVTKTKARSISPEKPPLGDRKGKGRERESAIEIEDEDEIEVTGSSPSKKSNKVDGEFSLSERG
jgi:hypothetical protein